MNVDLPAVARILYFLIDDKCNENGEMWWHWRKMALAIGVGRTRFFEAVEYLKSAGILITRRDGHRIYYGLKVFRKSGTLRNNYSAQAEQVFRSGGTIRTPVLISELDQETVALTAIAEDPENQPPKCYRCRDTGREILGKSAVCRCEAGTRLRRVA